MGADTQTPALPTAAAFVAVRAERDALRGFALRILADWPECGDVDGFEVQDAAVECGLLALANPPPVEPCGEGCPCAEFYDREEFAAGDVKCYRRTRVLMGDDEAVRDG